MLLIEISSDDEYLSKYPETHEFFKYRLPPNFKFISLTSIDGDALEVSYRSTTQENVTACGEYFVSEPHKSYLDIYKE